MKTIEERIEQIAYTQFYELPYNPSNKILKVIGTQESGTNIVARAFDMQGFLRQALLSHRQQIAEELVEALGGKVIKKNDDIRLGNSRPLKERNMLMKKYNQALLEAQQIIGERLK